MAKKKAKAPQNAKKKLRIQKAKAETFTLDFPKPEPSPFHEKRLAPPEERLELPQPSYAVKSMARKKEMPRALTALIGAIFFTLVFLAVFLIILQVGFMLAAALSIPLLVGFSILIYNVLESRQ